MFQYVAIHFIRLRNSGFNTNEGVAFAYAHSCTINLCYKYHLLKQNSCWEYFKFRQLWVKISNLDTFYYKN
jgi:hypothetical protein